jgi:hypothetical protein
LALGSHRDPAVVWRAYTVSAAVAVNAAYLTASETAVTPAPAPVCASVSVTTHEAVSLSTNLASNIGLPLTL